MLKGASMADMSKARNLRKENFWRRMLARRTQSGQSIRAFCQRHHLNECTYHWWRRTLAERDAVLPAAPRLESSPTPKFAPVQVTPDSLPAAPPPHPSAADGSELEIVLAGERRLRLRGQIDRAWLAEVVTALEALPVRGAASC
jgi:transposase-like protein